ncbi:Disease resistance protein [Corchorus capsularis]|uniref:Disease resistance protein n=1 Tax=Corchorus capsularis TaxID=210143 RepID=A0A1R3KWL0_COCAP|nr:Disease resistance protein [Corchorus capsularis]
MAEIPVSFILEKISYFLQNEIQILQGVPEELESIRDDLETLKASLRAADLVEDSDHQLKQWVRQVRDIAYDIEDAIDDFTYHHADQHGNRIHGFLYKFCCFAKTLKGYHRTADDLRKIKSRIGNVSAWQSNNNDRFKKTDQGSSSRTPVNDALILDSVDLVGTEEPKEKLVKWLVESNSRRRKVVSVFGMGGLGKTTLVKQVYDDERVKKRFDVHVWITLSHSLKLEDLLRNIVQQVFTAIRKPVPEGIDDMKSEWLKVAIKPYLQQWRYLSLRETEIKIIPSSIGKLQNLQTLDLKHTHVTELPVEILKLKQLRHLLVYRYEFKYYSRFHSKYGFKAFAGIGALKSLQKLCFIAADHKNPSILGEIGELTQLRRLGIMNLRKEDGMALCSSIQKLTNLEALSVVSSVKDEVIDLQHLSSPPKLLERLYLTGKLEQLPEWIPRLQSLVIVYLKWSRLEDNPLVSLQNLSNLVHLELLQVTTGDTLSFKAGGFRKLKVLGIDKFDELKCIEMEKDALPVLEKLSILRCKSLETVPLGIEHLTMLKVLEFFDMPEELIKTLSPNAENGDYSKVACIPEVYYTYCRDGEWEVFALESWGERVLNAKETVESHIGSIVKK